MFQLLKTLTIDYNMNIYFQKRVLLFYCIVTLSIWNRYHSTIALSVPFLASSSRSYTGTFQSKACYKLLSRHSISKNNCQIPNEINNQCLVAGLQHIDTNRGFSSLLLNTYSNYTTTTRKDFLLNEISFLAGSKRGELFHFYLRFPKSDELHLPTTLTTWGETQMGVYCTLVQDSLQPIVKPYPIYSMTFASKMNSADSPDKMIVACGGGDCHITVWETNSTMNISDDSYSWDIQTRLGPHTGWVKDVIYDPTCDLLFSIGCNCIEIWTQQNFPSQKVEKDIQKKKLKLKKKKSTMKSSFTTLWRHLYKLQIESSPDIGCTLSNDLLCLEIFNTSPSTLDHSNYDKLLFAGGVDGRIHIWRIIDSEYPRLKEERNQDRLDKMSIRDMSAMKNSIAKFYAFASHEGRVNKILSLESFKALVSIGHDGLVLFHDLVKIVNIEKNQNDSHDTLIITSQLNLNEESQENGLGKKRLLALCTLFDSQEEVAVAVGSSDGDIYIIHAEKKCNRINAKVIQCVHIDGAPSINKLGSFLKRKCCNKSMESEYGIVIAHSTGLSLLLVYM